MVKMFVCGAFMYSTCLQLAFKVYNAKQLLGVRSDDLVSPSTAFASCVLMTVFPTT